MTQKSLSFYETVLAAFDKAAAFTTHPPGILEQIKHFIAALDHPEKSASNIAESKQIINLCAENE